MKTTVLILFLLLLNVVSTVINAQQGRQQLSNKKISLYNPSSIYTGDYRPDVLLFKIPGSNTWQRITKLDRLRDVTCQKALIHLNREGKWRGHLNPDGSCGSLSEPSDWAMGNRLNYENDLE